MLYQTPRLRELHRFSAYAHARDQSERYNFSSFRDCAVCQFLGTSIFAWSTVIDGLLANEMNRLACPEHYEGITVSDPTDTWGNLAKRIDARIEELLTA